MEQSTLAEILGVEKEIRAQLDAEREQASRWLEAARREIEREHEAALRQLQHEAAQCRVAALEAARQRADAVVGDAERAVAAQAVMSDDELRALVRRRLACLVPESAA
jgi:vacuolar-type H+-ATPase subunit H